jgi:hypothetical protein
VSELEPGLAYETVLEEELSARTSSSRGEQLLLTLHLQGNLTAGIRRMTSAFASMQLLVFPA